MLSAPEVAHAIRTANADIIALIRGGGSDEQFSVFENPDLLRAWSEKRAYRVAGIGHPGNSTALDLLSDFAASTPAMAGTHIAGALRGHRDSQQHVADLQAQNDECSCPRCSATRRKAADAVTVFVAGGNSSTLAAERTNCVLVIACPSGSECSRA